MIPTEKRIAQFIKAHYDDFEDCIGIEYYCVYTDSALFDNAVSDCTLGDCKPTDVLSIEYAKNVETGHEYVQLFISTPDNDGQEWFKFSELSHRDQLNVVRLFEQMAVLDGFKQRAPVILL